MISRAETTIVEVNVKLTEYQSMISKIISKRNPKRMLFEETNPKVIFSAAKMY